MSKPLKHLTNSVYKFGPFHIVTKNCVLMRDGKIVPLKPKVFDTLLVLVERHTRVVSKEDLMGLLWPDTFVEENNLTSNISILRKILSEGSDGRSYIETIPKRGYRFVADVRELANEDITPSLEDRSGSLVLLDSGVRHLPSPAPISRRKTDFGWMILVSFLATIIVTGLAHFLNPIKSKSAVSDVQIKSIAVLPFTSLSTESRNESLEIGMAETLIAKLSSIKQLNIRPINAVRKYNKIDADPITAGRELEVDYVLQGNLQMNGDTVRASVHLWRISDRTEIHTDTCDRECTSLLQLEDALAQEISAKLALKLSDSERRQLDKHYTENTEAYRLYLKGRYYFNEQTREDYRKSIELYQQAIKIDPNYALAYAGLAQTYSFLRGNGLLPTTEIRKKQEAAAAQAVQLDGQLAEAHQALAELKAENWDWASAEREYQRAIELNPGGAEFHSRYAHYLRGMGRIEEAIAESSRALELDPKSPSRRAGLGNSKRAPGHYDEAIELYQQAISMRPGYAPFFANLGVVYLDAGMYKEAIEAFKEARSLDDDPSRRGRFAYLAYAYAMSGNKNEAQKMLAELKAREKETFIPPYNFAIIYHGLGDRDQTFNYLEKAYAERFPALSDIRNWREDDPFRADPRYLDLLRRMNLSP